MRIAVDRKEFIRAIQSARKVTTTKAKNVATAHILMRVTTSIELLTTDGTVDCAVHVPGHIIETGDTIIPAKETLEILKASKEEKIRITAKKIYGVEFATWPDKGTPKRFKYLDRDSTDHVTPLDWNARKGIEGKVRRVPVDMAKVLNAYRFAAKDDTQYSINGVLLDKNRIAATDGHRLIIIPAKENYVKIKKPITVPGPVLKYYNKLKKFMPGAVFFSTKKVQGISTENIRLYCHRDGSIEYPKFDHVAYPDDPIIKRYKIDADTFKASILKLLAADGWTDKFPVAKFTIFKKTVKGSHNIDAEKIVKDEIPIEPVNGQTARPYEVGFNLVYLLAIAETYPGQTIEFVHHDPLDGAHITGQDGTRITQMPVRL